MIFLVKVGGISKDGCCPIGGKDFNLDEGDTFEDVFLYCEKKYGFKSEEWDLIKEECDTEELENLLDAIGVRYDEYDDE